MAHKLLLQCFIMTVIFSTVPSLGTSPNDNSDIFPARVEDLRPTQSSVGFREVHGKVKKLEEMDKAERRKFLLENPLPVIVGPGGQLFPIDHFHLARAVLESGHQKLFVKIVDNPHIQVASQFWAWMEVHQYAYLFDSNGNSIEASMLPLTIADMTDDPFRSLAGEVREKGGYQKTFAPFAEFKWARFFHRYFSDEDLQEHFKKCLKKAIKIATSPSAQGLPGYRAQGPGACHSAFL